MMLGNEGPGALAGATGAGCLQAAAVSPQHIARRETQRHLEGTGGGHD
jgi:hypothetical protein